MCVRNDARARRAAYGLLLLAGSWSPAWAADPSVTSDLAAALRAAWLRHPAAEATEQTLAAAEARAAAAARPLYNPEVEVAVDRDADERSATAGLAWTLDVSGKRAARRALGEAELTRAEADASMRRSAFAQQWLQGWADYRTTLIRVRLGEQQLALVQRFSDLAERQLGAGDISSLERDLALLARDEAQAEHATLLSEAASAQEAFRAVGGVIGDGAVELPSGAPPALASTGMPLDRVPEARIAAASTLGAERRIAVAERDRRPDPTVRVQAGRVDLGPASDSVLGVAISVPLFVRNDYSAELTAARADASAAEAEQRRVALEIRARADRTVQTYDAVRAAWERWTHSSGTDVRKRADLLERLWRAGELSTADYVIQLKQSLDTALAGADLQGRLWRSYADALYATGRIDAWAGFDRSSEVTP